MAKPSVFGERLRELRRLRGWTQEELGDRSGVSAQMISHFETGTRQKASADNLVNLAEAFGCTVDYLLGRTDEPELTDPRVRTALRQLSKASGEMIDQTVSVVEAMLEAERRRRGKEELRE